MSKRLEAINFWLRTLFPADNYKLLPASEDASFRVYYRLFVQGESYIVMDAPPEHEDIKSFLKITGKLQDNRINVPSVYKSDMAQGFLLLTDFGDQLYLDNLDPGSADRLYRDALNTLIAMQTDTDISGLALYDETMLRQEMNIFMDWLVGRYLGINLSLQQQAALKAVFDTVVENALVQPQVFVHRDYHSRNLMVTETASPGVIDYQDAVLGPVSYDPVSLLKDCYIKWPEREIYGWMEAYIDRLISASPSQQIDRARFRRWFDLMGVQRHLKASGIFARLSFRDGKHGFLKDIPRTLSYILDLQGRYPELTVLCRLIETSLLPGLEKEPKCL